MSEPPPGRRLGSGYEPHVDEVDDRLVYSLPVDSGHTSLSFSFPISQAALTVLLEDRYRRAVLHWTSHTVLQRLMVRRRSDQAQACFEELAPQVLFSSADELTALIERLDAEHNIRLAFYIDQDLAAAGA